MATMKTPLFHSNRGIAPPWSTRASWQAANDAMAEALGNQRYCLYGITAVAEQIRDRVSLLDGFMEALCDQTCFACTDSCCHRATVWYDFKDLLGFHVGTAPIPPGQPISPPDRRCKYLTPSGCALPRIQRPFICTWFICVAQKRLMERWAPSHRTFLCNSLLALKDGRDRMEKLFIQEVVK